MSSLVVTRPSATSLWDKAVAQLPDEHKTGINFNRSEKIDVLQDLRDKAEASRDQFMKSRWKYTRKSGETVILRDVFANFVRWIDVFKQIGDIAVQCDPIHAGLPWAGVRFILQMAINDTQTLEQVIEGLTWVSELICRYTIVAGVAYVASAASKELEEAIVKLYTGILVYLSKTIEYLEKGTMKRMIKNAIPLDDIHKAEDNVEKWRALTEKNDSVEKNATMMRLLYDMNQPLKRMDQSLQNIQDNLEESERIEILNWLSRQPYMGHHRQVKDGLLEGSGGWLLSDPVFKKWKNDSASSILWLHGIVGSGKSKLVSVVIEDAIKDFENGNSPQPVFFYCERNKADQARSSPAAILASIARQLSNLKPDKPLLKPTVEMYMEEKKQAFPSGPPGMKEACKLIKQLVEVYPQTTIVIDAMDECDPKERLHLLKFLAIILEESSSLVKIFISSRNDQDIVLRLENYPNLEIDSQKNSEDIAKFVRKEVEELITNDELLLYSDAKDQLKEKIITKTIQGAKGMFRWASMQLEYLCSHTEDSDIEKALERSPPKLHDLYNDIYDKLMSQPGENQRIILKNCLYWLLSAQRKLSTDEFLIAVSTVPDQRTKISTSQKQVLKICNNFIIHDTQLNTFRFAHLSVREFLEERHDFDTPTINSLIAEACIWVVLARTSTSTTQKLFRNLQWKTDVEDNTVIKFGRYAHVYWGMHCKFAGDLRKSGTLEAAFRHLFLVEDKDLSMSYIDLCLSHIKAHKYPELWLGNSRERFASCAVREPSFGFGSLSAQIFVACAFDFEEFHETLPISKALTKPYRTLKGRSIVQVAALNRSHATISYLIRQNEFGAEHAVDMFGATQTGDREEVASQLISLWRADLRSRQSFLLGIIPMGSVAVIERFLDSWEDIKITKEMVELAIKKDVMYEAQEELRLDPLQPQYQPGAVNLVKLLLGRESDIKVTQEMVESSIEPKNQPFELAEFLFSQQQENITITEEMITSALRHKNGRYELLGLLLSQHNEDIVLTEDIMRAVKNSDDHVDALLRLLMSRRRKDVPVAAPTITFLVHDSNKKIVALIIDEFGVDTVVTEENVVAVLFSGSEYAVGTLKLFIRYRSEVVDMLMKLVDESHRMAELRPNLYRMQVRMCGWMYLKREDTGWRAM